MANRAGATKTAHRATRARRAALGASLTASVLLAACGASASDSAIAEVEGDATSSKAVENGAAQYTTADAAEGEEVSTRSRAAAPLPPLDQTDYGVNPRIDTEDDALSTFAIDVDTGSYTLGRTWVNDGILPDKNSVRVEEFVNYFDQGYEAPIQEPFSILVDGGPTPFVENEDYQMIRVGIASKVVDEQARPDANLTFVIDVSGSMEADNRLELVKSSLRTLVEELRPTDQVGIVTYGSTGEVVLEPTLVSEADEILNAIDRVRPGGSTNAEEGLILGYETARKAFENDDINRVILASDGVANVGRTGPEAILQLIQEQSQGGIHMVTLGVGLGNYNDTMMEQLADQGDGFYAYIDTEREAERLFRHDLTGSLLTVAEDAKIQVEFDPATVERYRLVGFENRDVADEDFRNDNVDAGEIGAGHTVTALYEVKLNPQARGVSDAKLGTVTLRWNDPEGGAAQELAQDITGAALAGDHAETSHGFQLATTVGAYGEVLRESPFAANVTLAQVADEAKRLTKADGFNQNADVLEFAEITSRAIGLA